jgi:hypothetical protein
MTYKANAVPEMPSIITVVDDIWKQIEFRLENRVKAGFNDTFRADQAQSQRAAQRIKWSSTASQ